MMYNFFHKQEETDYALIQKAYRGDQSAYEQLVKRYEAMLFSCAMSVVEDEATAKDILQSVWITLYETLPVLTDKETTIRAWLYNVTENRCIDELRKQQRRPLPFSTLHIPRENQPSGEEDTDLSFVLFDAGLSPEEHVEQQEQLAQVLQAIEQLSDRYRKIVFLRLIEGLRFKEIGSQLSIPTSQAKTYFPRGMKALRGILAEASGSSPKKKRKQQ